MCTCRPLRLGVGDDDPATEAAQVILDALSVASGIGQADYEADALGTALIRLGEIGAVTVGIDLESNQAHIDASDLVAGMLVLSDYLLERLTTVSDIPREQLIHDAREYASGTD